MASAVYCFPRMLGTRGGQHLPGVFRTDDHYAVLIAHDDISGHHDLAAYAYGYVDFTRSVFIRASRIHPTRIGQA